ncbi:44945_t:CDS:2 [Gigaspora margarita]|uniref:44945_t:CDS:1 n=1 Tax=Gigaspora margarita TaxID=4874 RepID=A0ABN7UEF4_GIGMA|nr:44945_t:CDS:2 [Gigaspora margarita]
MKHNYSSNRKEEIPLEKHRKTKTHSSNFLNYTHTLEESEVLKHLNAVQKLVEEEAIKTIHYLSL